MILTSVLVLGVITLWGYHHFVVKPAHEHLDSVHSRVVLLEIKGAKEAELKRVADLEAKEKPVKAAPKKGVK